MLIKFKKGEKLPLIDTNEVEVGMKVSEDVRDRTGKVLLTQGQTLEEKHLKAFKIWGIRKIFVELGNKTDPENSEKGQKATTPNKTDLKKPNSQLERIFNFVNREESPHMQAIFEFAQENNK